MAERLLLVARLMVSGLDVAGLDGATQESEYNNCLGSCFNRQCWALPAVGAGWGKC